MQIDPSKLINFNSYEWQVIEKWVLEQEKTKVGLLIAADNHDTSNQIRGALKFIKQLLALKSAAQITPQ